MRPIISNTPYYKLTIPELSGGVNLRDGISLINDNQLTECKNVWYRDGMLKTRPGVKYNRNPEFLKDIYFEDIPLKNIYANPKNYRVIGGVTYFLVCLQSSSSLEFRYYRGDGKAEEDTVLSYLEVGGIYTDELPPGDFTCNIFQYGNDIYCFCSGYYEKQTVPYYIYKISEIGTDTAKAAWSISRVGVDEGVEPYVPTVAMNATALPGEAAITMDPQLAAIGFKDANFIEGLNLLGNKMKLFYSTVNSELLEVNPFFEEGSEMFNVPYHVMIYAIPHITKFVGESEVSATITYSDGRVAKHKVAISVNIEETKYEFYETSTNSIDGKEMRITINTEEEYGFISFLDNTDFTDGRAYVTDAEKNMYNNMEVIAPCSNSRENHEKILNMEFNEWYGGGSEGLYGGIHLFMAGNKGDEKSLVCWSDFNKPLYFSENNYAYVGDKSQAVTAFGKQGESLMIFKEREIYATQYSTLNDSISADDVINQAVVDVAANEVAFPMAQVHGFIGCDCPKTVQLCRNRLVWAHSDGKVYTLVSANQYNERSIFEVSDMVEKRLKTHSADELQSALSADWEGHYVLSVGDKLYLMDYNSYGYSNVYSYSKSEDAQERIPWWLWDTPQYKGWRYVYGEGAAPERLCVGKLPFNIRALICIADGLFLSGTITGSTETDYELYLHEMMCIKNGNMNDEFPKFAVSGSEYAHHPEYDKADPLEIPSMIQTKFFDFGSPTVKKNVPKVEVTFGTNGGVPIKTTVITENAADEGELVIDEPEEQEHAAGYFHNRLIRPGNKRACRIGLRFESEGDMSIDAISLQYKTLGGLK